MAKSSFDYQAAKNDGYTDEEIMSHLSSVNPDFDFESAQKDGYTPQEINEHLANYKPERSNLAKAGRVAGQFALGRASAAALPYEIAVAPLASKDAQNVQYRQTVMDDVERLQEQRATGQWDEQDQKLYDSLLDQIRDPRKSEKFVQTGDMSIKGLTEKATGLDLEPEGLLEKGANWLGFIRKPGASLTLKSAGVTPKELIKAIMPGSKTEVLRGVSAGAAMQLAEDGHFGPLGHLASVIVGDIIGHGPKAIIDVAKNPKKYSAKMLNFLTQSNSKKSIAKDFIEEARQSGIQLDVGSLTQSNLVKMIQARASQSGLSGASLDNFKKELSGQIIREYESILGDLGEFRFENTYQASEAIKEALKIEEAALNMPQEATHEARSLQGRIKVEERPDYQQKLLNKIAPQEIENTAKTGQELKGAAQEIKEPIKKEFEKQWSNFNEKIQEIPVSPQAKLVEDLDMFVSSHKGSLLLGESAAEARVLKSAENLLQRLSAEGGLVGVSLKDLIKTKRTLADVANWEFGGSNFESAYKKLVGDIDNAIKQELQRVNPQLLQEFEQLNSSYSAFKDIFENKNVIKLFEPKNRNYNALVNGFVENPDKLRALENVMKISPNGQKVLGEVKREVAKKAMSKKDLSELDIRNLESALGPEYKEAVEEFAGNRQYAIDNPLPKAVKGKPLGVAAQVMQPKQLPSIKGRAKEAAQHTRQKMYEYLAKKNPDQVMKMMDSVAGIKKLKNALSLTPEGKQLFSELSRYKLSEMIDAKMTSNISQNVKLGTFSNLLSSKENKAIAKELLGADNLSRLERLQKVSGRLAESAAKFFNASQSGTTASDSALMSAAVVGAIMGNPFVAGSALASIGGYKIIASLFSDKKFLKYLEEAILTDNPVKMAKIFEKMIPSVQKAIIEDQSGYSSEND